MPKYFAALTIVLMLGMVLTRVLLMRRRGIEAMNFGKIDKTDFLVRSLVLSGRSSPVIVEFDFVWAEFPRGH